MLMPAPYRDEHPEYIARYERTGTPQAIGRIRNVHALRKNGEVFPIELSVSDMGSPRGRVTRLSCSSISGRA